MVGWSQHMTERQPYTLIRRYPDFELRHYPDYTLVQCEVTGDFMEAGYRGFRPLFNFITGTNARGQSIAMTAPVLQATGPAQSHLVSFVMPADMAPEDVPAPRDSKVTLKHVAGHDAAVIPYRGSWSTEELQKRTELLATALKREGLVSTGDPYYARFNPPWVPSLFKLNEVLVPVAGSAKG